PSTPPPAVTPTNRGPYRGPACHTDARNPHTTVATTSRARPAPPTSGYATCAPTVAASNPQLPTPAPTPALHRESPAVCSGRARVTAEGCAPARRTAGRRPGTRTAATRPRTPAAGTAARPATSPPAPPGSTGARSSPSPPPAAPPTPGRPAPAPAPPGARAAPPAR